MHEDRIVELETRLAYQEHTIAVLNDAVTQQGRQIEQLERLCRALIERLRENSEGVFRGTAADEIPPHY